MKMSKKKAAVFGMAAATLFSVGGFSSCGQDPGPPAVYGPPTDFGIEDNQQEDVYGPPVDFDVDVEDNEPSGVYGPPADFDMEENEDDTVSDDTAVSDDFATVSDNEEPPLYGPPEELEVENNENADVYGPPVE